MSVVPDRHDSEKVLFVTVRLREGVVPPPDAPWLVPGNLYDAFVVLIDDREAFVRIVGPDGARVIMSSRDVRRLADDWPDH
jgi:hypothetical protein